MFSGRQFLEAGDLGIKGLLVLGRPHTLDAWVCWTVQAQLFDDSRSDPEHDCAREKLRAVTHEGFSLEAPRRVVTRLERYPILALSPRTTQCPLHISSMR